MAQETTGRVKPRRKKGVPRPTHRVRQHSPHQLDTETARALLDLMQGKPTAAQSAPHDTASRIPRPERDDRDPGGVLEQCLLDLLCPVPSKLSIERHDRHREYLAANGARFAQLYETLLEQAIEPALDHKSKRELVAAFLQRATHARQ